MSEQNKMSTGSKIGLSILGILLLGIAFALGIAFQPLLLGKTEVLELPVTREVEVTRQVEIITEQEVTREVTITEKVPIEVEVEVTRIVEPTTTDDNTTRAPEKPTIPATDLTTEDIAIFLEVWRNIEEDFDGNLPSTEQLNHALIRGALDTLDDPYTRFLNPELAERERESLEGAYEGIGAFVRETDEGFIEITRPIDGQPAQQVGLQSGDLIIGVDGEDIIGQGIDEVISKVRGPRGTDVRLLIAREGEEPFEVTITRARVEIPILETDILEGNIAYLHLTTFAAYGIDQTVLTAVQELIQQNPNGFILDLRDNPGGFLDASVNIADIFLPESVVLYEKSESGIFNRTFTAENGDIGEEIPLVVLVNGGSASASELVAGALRDNGRATLIGEQTFGKGSVQQIRSLPDGSELRLTIARWYTPNNNNINGEGLTPDIIEELTPGALLASPEDNQLQRAIQYLNENN